MLDLSPVIPPWIGLDPLLQSWLLEDIGRGDRTTLALKGPHHQAERKNLMASSRVRESPGCSASLAS